MFSCSTNLTPTSSKPQTPKYVILHHFDQTSPTNAINLQNRQPAPTPIFSTKHYQTLSFSKTSVLPKPLFIKQHYSHEPLINKPQHSCPKPTFSTNYNHSPPYINTVQPIIVQQQLLPTNSSTQSLFSKPQYFQPNTIILMLTDSMPKHKNWQAKQTNVNTRGRYRASQQSHRSTAHQTSVAFNNINTVYCHFLLSTQSKSFSLKELETHSNLFKQTGLSELNTHSERCFRTVERLTVQYWLRGQ